MKVTTVLFIVSCFTTGCVTGPRGVPPRYGILNFGEVNKHLFRGAEPDTAAIHQLKRLGVRKIIDLRIGKEVRPEEKLEAKRAGMDYVNVPMPGLSGPKHGEVLTVLSLMAASRSRVFIHCQHGCDRTGTVIACYRIRNDHWTRDRARSEAKAYGMSEWEFGMKNYIAKFARSQ